MFSLFIELRQKLIIIESKAIQAEEQFHAALEKKKDQEPYTIETLKLELASNYATSNLRDEKGKLFTQAKRKRTAEKIYEIMTFEFSGAPDIAERKKQKLCGEEKFTIEYVNKIVGKAENYKSQYLQDL